MLSTVVKYLLIFFVGALLGYIIELFYRRFVSQKKWMNPGFLTGPYLPLYGFGLVTLYVICEIDLSSLSMWLEILIKSLIILVMMTLIEYIAGLIFIKGMKIKLWDYSTQWGNIGGIICPLYTLFWGLLGFIYYIFIHPFIKDIVLIWSENQILSFFVGSIFGIFIVDFATSMHLATRIRSFAKEHDVVIQFETMKGTISQFPGKVRERIERAFDEYKKKTQSLESVYLADRYAKAGLYTCGFGFLGLPLIFSIRGLKSTKYKKSAIVGTIISATEIIIIFVLAFIYKKYF